MDPASITGHLVIVMAPTGSGKKQFIDRIFSSVPGIRFAHTITSREPRHGVTENPLYTFVSKEQFDHLVEEDNFIETAEYGGNFYGTPKAEIINPLIAGEVVVKEMELQGVQQLLQVLPRDHVTVIYIDAGDWESLERRLTEHGALSPEELAVRKEQYEIETDAKSVADVVIPNVDGQLEDALTLFEVTVRDLKEKYTNAT